jgi:hypothetical protein
METSMTWSEFLQTPMTADERSFWQELHRCYPHLHIVRKDSGKTYVKGIKLKKQTEA